VDAQHLPASSVQVSDQWLLAAGVEDEQQRRILVEHGWTHGQGRLFGAPAAWDRHATRG
jgi:EAL domain-containing protein (putative c-di-GMP-specific phosphodiesterase class I)